MTQTQVFEMLINVYREYMIFLLPIVATMAGINFIIYQLYKIMFNSYR